MEMNAELEIFAGNTSPAVFPVNLRISRGREAWVL